MTMANVKIPLLVTGSSGLVASHLIKLFADRYQCDKLDISNPGESVDITKPEEVRQAVARSQAQFLVHFAAFTDVAKAWQETGNKTGLTYKVNVLGTKNIARACQDFGKHLIHVSTAYVFDGRKPTPYLEADQPKPIEWYGQTKWEAEQMVMTTTDKWTILRIDQPFGLLPANKPDIVKKIVTQLQNNTLPPQFANHTFGPTFINDFVKVIDWVVRTKTAGLFHASSGESWTDYDFATAIKQACHSKAQINPGNLDSYLATTNRPYQANTALNCNKLISQLDFKLLPISQAIHQAIV